MFGFLKRDTLPHLFPTEGIKFIYDYWIYYSDYLEDRGTYLDLLNPRIMMEEVVAECEMNLLINKNNREYFIRRLSTFRKTDPYIKAHLAAEFEVLEKSLDKEDAYASLLSVNQILPTFESKSYALNLIDVLSQLSLEPNLNSKKKVDIKYIVESLITELIYFGYSCEDISRLMQNQFSEIQAYDDMLVTSYPINFNFPEKKEERPAYNARLMDYMSSITIEDRVSGLKTYVNMPQSEYVVKMSLDGIVTSGKELSIGDVTFTTLGSPSYLKGLREDENNRTVIIDKYKVFAQVRTLAISGTSAAIQASDKLRRTLQIMKLYDSSKYSPSIGKEYEYYIEGKWMGNNHFEGPSPFIAPIECIQIENHCREGFEVLYNSKLMTDMTIRKDEHDSTQIYNAINWFSKANSYETDDNIILFSWISLESLIGYSKLAIQSSVVQKKNVKKEDIAIQYIPYIIVNHHFTSKVFDLYFELRGLYFSSADEGRILKIDEEVARRVRFLDGGTIAVRLDEVIGYLKDIRDNLNREVLIDIIDNVIKVYASGKEAHEVITSVLNSAKDGILTIYRYRNQLAHNARSDSIIFKYIARLSLLYSNQTIKTILEHKLKNPSSTIEENIAKIRLKIEADHLKFKQNQLVDADKVFRWNNHVSNVPDLS